MNGVSGEILATPAAHLAEKLPGPSLFHIRGEQSPPIFVSVLLHGNELSGWHAVCAYLKENPIPPRSIMLFVGNVAAAAQHVRTTQGQADFNRIWGPDAQHAPGFTHQLIEQVVRHKPMIAVDIHNNTGKNPHYSVLTSLNPASRGLAFMFSDKAVLVEEPETVLSRTMEKYCPSVAVEVGPIDDPDSDVRATQLIKRCANIGQLPADPGDALLMYQAVARMHVCTDIQFDFADHLTEDKISQDDLILTAGIEAVNFHVLDVGFEIGVICTPLTSALQVLNPSHEDVTDQFLAEERGRVVLRQPVIPAMFTTDKAVVRQDCLGYLMRRLDLP